MDIKRMHSAIETLSSWYLCEVEKGKECFDLCAAGQVAYMMKDLADAMEHRQKQKYYEKLTCYMEKEIEMMEADEKEGRYGYDHYRYASSGRFAPKGKGSYYSGYTPMDGKMMDEKDVFDDFNGMRGYPHVRVGRPPRIHESRMGYPMYDTMPSEHGRRYDDYKEAKRHYTETKDASQHKMMQERIEDHVDDAVDTMKEMWADASPETRKEMKMNITKLLEDWAKTPV